MKNKKDENEQGNNPENAGKNRDPDKKMDIDPNHSGRLPEPGLAGIGRTSR